MMSRVARLSTSVGAHVLGSCSLRRDVPTAPKVVLEGVQGDSHLHHDHAYCKINLPTRRRNPSSCSDPFLGGSPSVDDRLVTYLDLDTWSKANIAPASLEEPFDSIDLGPLSQHETWLETFAPIDESLLSPYASPCSSSQFDELSDCVDWDVSSLDIDVIVIDKFKAWNSYLSDDCKKQPLLDVFDVVKAEVVEAVVKEEPQDDYFEHTVFSVKKELSPDSFEDYDEKPIIKKRGVVMKPRVDDETDRRRAMNRLAALRYRERMRKEKHRKRVVYRELERRNTKLKGEERQLLKEIESMKKRLHNCGVSI